MINSVSELLNYKEGAQSNILLRIMAGSVFFWEGLIKFVFQNQGVGRFTKIGFPIPEFTSTFVALLEIIGGLLLIFGLFTRVICIPFIIEMFIAMLSTKITMFLGTSPLALPPSPPVSGFWAVLHEVRSEYAQLICCLYLLINGPGRMSLDAIFFRKKSVNIESTD